jgi:hypothetical protein
VGSAYAGRRLRGEAAHHYWIIVNSLHEPILRRGNEENGCDVRGAGPVPVLHHAQTLVLREYETMLIGVLTSSEEGDAKLDHQGVGVMDTCGFPLFSHDLQDDSRNPERSNT